MNVYFQADDQAHYDIGFDSLAGISLFCKDTLILAEHTPADFSASLKKLFAIDEEQIYNLERAKKLANAMSLCHAFSGQDGDLIIKLKGDGAHVIKINNKWEFSVDSRREWPNPYVSIIQTCEERILKIREEQSSKQRRYDNIMRLISERYPKFLDAVK